MPARAGITCATVVLRRKATSCRLPALAQTLKTVATKGPRAFYEGAIADDMVATLTGAARS